MNIKIDDNFKISLDSSGQNLQLEKLCDVIDKKTREFVRKDFSIVGFHGLSLRSVLFQYKNESLAADDKLESINDVIDKLNEIEKTISKLVKNIKLDVKSDD
jgi:hypothetical protein